MPEPEFQLTSVRCRHANYIAKVEGFIEGERVFYYVEVLERGNDDTYLRCRTESFIIGNIVLSFFATANDMPHLCFLLRNGYDLVPDTAMVDLDQPFNGGVSFLPTPAEIDEMMKTPLGPKDEEREGA